MTLNPGELIHDRYRIEGIIGKGGMGAVYYGEDTVLSVPVAIKENLNPLPQAVRQFKREALLLASLRHTNLPRVTDHFVIGDLQYLIMDFIPGDDLKTILEHEGAQPEEKVLSWAREVCGALAYLHEQHPPVIHRDVKPANIKIMPNGRPVLVDFGIAKTAETGGVTTTGARSLTPGFAPPEQYGSSPTDGRSDQYSLAATIYNLLTGVIPPDSLERTLGQAALKQVRELNPAVSLAVDRTLWKAMSLSPSDRFAHIGDFLEALEGRLAVAETTPVSREPLTQVHRVPEEPTQQQPPPPEEGPPSAPAARRALPLALLGGMGGLACIFAIVVALVWVVPRIRAALAGQTASPSPAITATRRAAALKTAAPVSATPVFTNTPGPTATATEKPTQQPSPTRTATVAPTPLGGGRLLAFVSNRSEDRHFQVYTLDFDTKSVVQLTFDPTDKGRLAWSPDGQQIYFEEKMKNGKWDIFRMNADGSQAQNLTNNDADDLYPAPSPTGALVAFVSKRIEGYTHIYTMALDGSDVVDISAKHKKKPFNMPSEWDPAWSPDGRFLYMILSPTGPMRVYRWDTMLPDSDPAMVTVFDGNYWEGEPDVSPQGNLVAYSLHLDDGVEICVSETDLAKRRICDNPITNRIWNSDPAWSPDGMWLAFTSRRSGDGEIYTMTVSGSNQTNQTNLKTAEDRYPAWQPARKNP
jgi:Tol biopolymer transport system component